MKRTTGPKDERGLIRDEAAEEAPRLVCSWCGDSVECDRYGVHRRDCPYNPDPSAPERRQTRDLQIRDEGDWGDYVRGRDREERVLPWRSSGVLFRRLYPSPEAPGVFLSDIALGLPGEDAVPLTRGSFAWSVFAGPTRSSA